MPVRIACCLALTTLCCAAPALAQTDLVALSNQAAANQLGLLEYCQARGDVGDDAVAAERGAIARLPPSTTVTDAAESLGKAGTFSTAGTTMTLASMASSRQSSVADICKQLGASAVQSAAAFQGAGAFGTTGIPAMPAMPSIPGFGAMPALPPGIPAFPGLPTAAPTR